MAALAAVKQRAEHGAVRLLRAQRLPTVGAWATLVYPIRAMSTQCWESWPAYLTSHVQKKQRV